MNSKICISNLSFQVGDKHILDEVDMQIREGEFVGFIGPNGSGKTSIINHIYKNLPADCNTIFLDNISIENYSYKKMAQIVSVLKQENENFFDYKVEDMVLMGRIPYKKYFEGDSPEDYQKINSALEYVGLKGYKDRLFMNLSGGEKQRVLLARTLVQETDIILLDEPTNHLDIYYQWKLIEMIKNLRKTVVAVIHELNIALRFCDYIYVIDKGKIKHQGTPEEICKAGVLKEVFHLDLEIIRHKGGPYIIYDY